MVTSTTKLQDFPRSTSRLWSHPDTNCDSYGSIKSVIQLIPKYSSVKHGEYTHISTFRFSYTFHWMSKYSSDVGSHIVPVCQFPHTHTHTHTHHFKDYLQLLWQWLPNPWSYDTLQCSLVQAQQMDTIHTIHPPAALYRLHYYVVVGVRWQGPVTLTSTLTTHSCSKWGGGLVCL